MRRVLLILFLFMVMLNGCATTQMVKPTIKDSEVIQAPFDRVWEALIATLAEKALPIESIEKESGLSYYEICNLYHWWTP